MAEGFRTKSVTVYFGSYHTYRDMKIQMRLLPSLRDHWRSLPPSLISPCRYTRFSTPQRPEDQPCIVYMAHSAGGFMVSGR
jgi:hypothetical protein